MSSFKRKAINRNMIFNINNMNINPNNMGMMNNNMTPNNYYLSSNLVGNVIRPRFFYPLQQQNLSLRFWLNNMHYILKIEKIESSNSILFSCHNENDDITLLYEYSCFLSYNELHNMNRAFQICDDIKQIFTSIENTLIKDIKTAIPRIDFFQNNEDSLVFFFRIPLISGQNEDINIILQKKERNINMQFDKLVKQYEEIRKIIKDNSKNDDKIRNITRLVYPSTIYGHS